MKGKEAIETVKENCVRVSIYITDAFESPYCNFTNKVFCDNEKTQFEVEIHDILRDFKQKGTGKPSIEQSTEMLRDMNDLCQRYENIKSENVFVPSASVNITMAEDLTIEDLGIFTSKDEFLLDF